MTQVPRILPFESWKKYYKDQIEFEELEDEEDIIYYWEECNEDVVYYITDYYQQYDFNSKPAMDDSYYYFQEKDYDDRRDPSFESWSEARSFIFKELKVDDRLEGDDLIEEWMRRYDMDWFDYFVYDGDRFRNDDDHVFKTREEAEKYLGR